MLGGGIGLAASGAGPTGPSGVEGAPPPEEAAGPPAPVTATGEAGAAGAAETETPGPFAGLPALFGSFATVGPALGEAFQAGPGGTNFGLPFADMFGGAQGAEEAQEPGLAAPEAAEPSAQAEGQAAEPGEEDEEETGAPTGNRHVDERELIASVHRRLLVERERMGGFGALIR